MPSLRRTLWKVKARCSYLAHIGLGYSSQAVGVNVPGFIILAQGRTGSTLLTDLLNSHPSICCEGEVLGTRRRFIEPFIAGKSTRFSLTGRTWGFKAKHYQIAESFPGGGDKFLARIQKTGWRIIWLRRRNLVRASLSTLVGIERKTWAYNRMDIRAQPSVCIDPDDFARHLHGRVAQNQTELSFLEDLGYLEVVYERDLAKVGEQTELPDVLDYLHVRRLPLQTTLRPTEERPLCEYVTNWPALREIAIREGFGELAIEAERQG